MKRVVAALLCVCSAPFAGAAEIVLTISNLKIELVDMTPGDGVDPWVTGIPLGSPWPTYVNRAASYTGYPNESQIGGTTQWDFELGPNSALAWSIDYRYEATLYQGYGTDEWVEGWFGVGSAGADSQAIFDRPFYAFAAGAQFPSGDPLPRQRLTFVESDTLSAMTPGLSGQASSGFFNATGFMVQVNDGLLVEPVSAVPEPGTWAFMLAGLAALIGGCRLGRRASRLPACA